MCADDDTSEDWRTIANAAGLVAARYGITTDEAMRVLDFEAGLFGLPLIRVAHLALSVRSPDRSAAASPDRPTAGAPDQDAPEPPDQDAPVVGDQPRTTTAADRAARRWGRPPPDQRPHARRSDLAAAVVAAVEAARRPAGVTFTDALGGRRRLVLDGEALGRYLDEGGPAGALGSPVSERRPVTPGPDAPLGADQEVAFARGTIYLDGAGCTKVVLIDDECL